MSQRDELALKEYLEHIKQAISRIQRYVADMEIQVNAALP